MRKALAVSTVLAMMCGWANAQESGNAEADVLAAIQAFSDASENGEVEAQLDFYTDYWFEDNEMTKAELKAYLEEEEGGKGSSFLLDDAKVMIEAIDKATVDYVELQSATGGGTFTFVMILEPDNVWRCAVMSRTKDPDFDAETARRRREQILNDPERPGYHFVIPEGIAMPFDPNGAIYWKGRYHLFYIFQSSQTGQVADHWGHMSSTDLFHWRHHPTGLLDGMYSGNAFINKEGVPTICYHQVKQGNAMAVALDDDLNAWKKLDSNPITPETKEGDEHHDKYRSWDPFGWVEDDMYYAIFGGAHPGVAKAPTLGGEWNYVGDLFAHGVEGVSLEEDVSCADLFKLGDKHVLLCISHALGCRYYVGEWKNEQFYPESHAQMSWVDNSYFAPESLVDDKGRRIMWAWIFDEPEFRVRDDHGWSGTMGLPRVLTLGDDGLLRMDVPEEIETLRYDAFKKEDFDLQNGEDLVVEEIAGNSIELIIDVETSEDTSFGVKVCASPGGEEETYVYYDAAEGAVKIDTRLSGPEDTPKTVEAGPFELKDGERLKLRVFVDKSVVEVFANSRQAVMRRIYPSRPDSVGVSLFSKGGTTQVHKLEAWKISPSNPY